MKPAVKIILFFPLILLTFLIFHQFFFGNSPGLYLLSLQSCSTICHQEQAKSFFVDGIKMPVCCRCTGIYFGAFNAFLISFFVTKIFFKNLNAYFLVMILLAADVLSVTAGFYSYNKVFSFLTGFLFGYSTFYYICIGFNKLLSELSPR